MNSTSNVGDLQLVQASRLEDQRLKKAVTRGKFNPYPEGNFVKNSISSLEFADNVGDSYSTYLAPSLLRSLDSLLPDYILEAMYRSLHDEDTGLYDFLGIFDHRLIELGISVEKLGLLITCQDNVTNKSKEQTTLNNIEKLQNLSNKRAGYICLLFALLNGSRSLSDLKQIIYWLTGQRVLVSAFFNKKELIDVEARSYISTFKRFNNALGAGTILGKKGVSNIGRIVITFQCKNYKEFLDLKNSTIINEIMPSVIKQYFRNDIFASIFAELQSEMFDRPILSRDFKKSIRLGEYNCLSHNSKNNIIRRIKILELTPNFITQRS